MLATGYQELYGTGQDGNWEYADYQIGKIKVAVESGWQRSPKCAQQIVCVAT